MKTFNNDFYQNNAKYTREQAESKMIENGYSNFHFKGCSFSNGSSFYFDVDGKEVRVSDHILTGKRAFDTIQISFVEVKTLKTNIVKKTGGISELMKAVYATMLKKGVISEQEYLIKIAG